MRALAIALVLALAAPMARAEGPGSSIRPVANPRAPAPIAAEVPAAAAVAQPPDPEADARPRPRPRPALLAGVQVPASDPSALPPDPLPQPSVGSPRPRARPEGLGASVALASAPAPEPEPTVPKGKKEKSSKKGSVCGDPAIKGEKLARISSKVKGCGVESPVKVTSIDGIRLNQPATISCETAEALRDWIRGAMIPAMGNREVVELRIAASYICRPRNNKKGAKISEHGRGKAVDVAGFVFDDGKIWTIAGDYNKQIRKAHKGACGIFGTTLGPGSDGYHEDHLHFDIARYNSGPYCR